MNRLTLGILATFVVILLGSGLLAYVFRDRSTGVNSGAAQTASSPGPAATPQAGAESQNKRGSHPFLLAPPPQISQTVDASPDLRPKTTNKILDV